LESLPFDRGRLTAGIELHEAPPSGCGNPPDQQYKPSHGLIILECGVSVRRVVVIEFREARTVDGRPICENCDRQMWLLSIKPADNGNELRTFECSKCAGSMTIIVVREPKSAP
jgi:hypothetical protein